LGTPIASNFFITAAHFGGTPGELFNFQGVNYVTDAFFDDPNSDLRIWKVTGTFPTFAPLYTKSDEVGKSFVVFGRGTQRGAQVTSAGMVRGWLWGNSDAVQRWGTNDVSRINNGPA